MNFPNIIAAPCLDTSAPPSDNRCSDPAFALAHPEVCGAVPVLELKPGVLLTCVLGSVHFRVFLVKLGIETELTSGVVFTSSNTDVAVVGAISGSATGVGAGTVNITASYQGLTTKAKLTVLGGGNCCSNNRIGTFLVLDVSKSMSMGFGGGYSTRLDYAKAVATRYSNETNLQKDQVGLISFDSTPTLDEALSKDLTTMASSIAGLITTPQLTGIGLALQQAVNALDAADIDLKVIVLVSDGEDKDTVVADDALTIAQTFRDNGGIIIVVGARAHDAGYSLLNGLATGGFFLNAYPAVAAQVLDQVSGLKGYICAGNCAPPGDVFQSVGALNYTKFANWDVTSGHVDLIGPGMFDLLPGNGFYVDMAGSSLGYAGQLTSKTAFAFVINRTYRLSFSLAGNQRKDIPNYKLRAQIGDGTILLQEIGMPDYTQDFTLFSFSFTVASAKTGNIIFTQLMGLSADNAFGLLLDNVKLEDVTGLTTLFSDSFDIENFVYIPPACGTKTVGYGGGGNPISNPPAPILLPGGDIINQIADPAAPTAVGNTGTAIPDAHIDVSPFYQDASVNNISTGTGGLAGVPVCYSIVYLTATGHTAGSGTHWNSSGVTDSNQVNLLRPQPLDPRITAVQIWRSLGNLCSAATIHLLAELPPGTTSYVDGESVAAFTARAAAATVPTTNTTAGSPGDMNPGETYQYAVSWLTNEGETNLSPALVQVVPAGSHALLITLPTSVPATATAWRLWRYDLVDVARYYLLDAETVDVLTFLDSNSIDDFQNIKGSTPAPPSSNTTGTSNHPGSIPVGVATQYAISYRTPTGETALSPAATITLTTGYSSIEIQTVVNPTSVIAKRVWRYSGGRYYLVTTLSPSTFNYYDLLDDATFVAGANASIQAPTGNTTGTGSSYFTYYGYNCYGVGCLADGIGTQMQDPNPLADIEANYVPPTTYKSTKSFTANCPAGSAQSSTSSAVPVMTSPTAPSGLVVTGGGAETAGYETWRVFGNGPAWRSGFQTGALVYGFPAAKTIVSMGITSEIAFSGTFIVIGANSLSGGSNLGVGVGTTLISSTLTLAAGERTLITLTNPGSYLYYYLGISNNSGNLQLTLLELFEAGTISPGVTKSSTKTSTISQADADAKALADAQTLAYAALTCVPLYTSHQSYTAKCAAGSFGLDSTSFGTASSLISQTAADAVALDIAKVNATTGLNCTLSNNDQALTLNDFAPSSPYPSVCYVSGKPGFVTKVTVKIIGLQHAYPSDLCFFLRGPTGATAMLFRNAATTGGADLFNSAIFGVDLTFDDAASGVLPQHAKIVSGTFKPTQYGVNPVFADPAPAGPYVPTLAPFIGTRPNGAYSLWVQDFKGLDVGKIAGGWTITVTAS